MGSSFPNEEKRQLVKNYFKMQFGGQHVSRWEVLGDNSVRRSSFLRTTSHSSISSSFTHSLPPPLFFELSPTGLALLSPVLIGSLTNPVVPLNVQCITLGGDFLLQEGREVAIFLKCK